MRGRAPARSVLSEPVSRRRVEAHHRRRRATALVVLALLALLVGISVGAGDGGVAVSKAPHPPPGYFARLRTLGGVEPGSFSFEEQGAETAAINRTLSYTPYVRIAGAQHKEIALTFDDGPGPYTPQVLAILGREEVPGTFFEVGALEQYFHASTSEIVARGYPIGDHTESHAPMGKLSAQDQQSSAAAAGVSDRPVRRAVPAAVPASVRIV